MTAQKGSEFLLKIGDGGGPETFATVGGFRDNTFRIYNEIIDTTSKDSGGKRELLAGGGIQSIVATGNGVFVDDAAFATVHTAVLASSTNNWQIIVPDFGIYEGPFQVNSLEFSGGFKGEQTYSISLESAGTITFTPA